jgi:hypothetical protein
LSKILDDYELLDASAKFGIWSSVGSVDNIVLHHFIGCVVLEIVSEIVLQLVFERQNRSEYCYRAGLTRFSLEIDESVEIAFENRVLDCISSTSIWKCRCVTTEIVCDIARSANLDILNVWEQYWMSLLASEAAECIAVLIRSWISSSVARSVALKSRIIDLCDRRNRNSALSQASTAL